MDHGIGALRHGVSPPDIDIPSSATIGNSIENMLAVRAGNAGTTLCVIGFEPWMGSGAAPTMGPGANANCQVVPLSNWGGLWKNGQFIGNVQMGFEVSLEVNQGDTLWCPGGMTLVYAINPNAWAPAMHTGFGGTEFSIYVFRGASAANPAQSAFLVGDQSATVTVTDGAGAPVFNDTFDALESFTIPLPAVGEYRLSSTADISQSKQHAGAIDVAVIFPATSEPLIGWARFGQLTSYDAEPAGFEIYMRDGVVGSGTMQFGAPASIGGFGSDSYLAPNGAGIIYPQARGACFAGADGNGGELVSWQPTAWLPNMVGLPCSWGNNRRISICSPFAGTYNIHDAASIAAMTTGGATPLATRALTRSGTTDQRAPAADRFDSSALATASLLVGQVPLNVAVNLPEPDRFYATPTTSNWAEETHVFGKRTDGFRFPHLDPLTGESYVQDVVAGTFARA